MGANYFYAHIDDDTLKKIVPEDEKTIFFFKGEV
jgi:hypothetical protein